MFDYSDRHPSTQHMMKMLEPNPNLKGHTFSIASWAYGAARTLLQDLPDSPEVTAGLRKLLEAKDCFVRAAVDANPVDYRDR